MRIRGSRVSVDPSGLAVVTTTDVQAALAELDAAVDGLSGGAVDAADVAFTPSGTVASTNVQDAIAEVAAESGGGGGGGGGSWTGFTPTVVQNATLTVDTGFSDCEYLINGGVAFVRGKIAITGSSGTSGWTLFVTLPGAVAARAHAGGTEADAQHYPVGIAVWENPGTLHQQLVANSLTATQLMFHKPDGYQGAGVNPAAGFDTADTLSLHLTIPLA